MPEKKVLKKKECGTAKIKNTTEEKCSTAKKSEVIEEEIFKIENTCLTDKQKLFCLYYIRSFNATQAAIKSGFSTVSAGTEGWRLLMKDEVKAEIQHLKELRFKSISISQDDILERYIRIAFADMSDFTNFGTEEITKVNKEGRETIYKDNFLDFKDSSQVDGGLICEIKIGKQGTSIKLEDRQKALDWLANYFDMNPAHRHKKWFDAKKINIEEERLKLDKERNKSISGGEASINWLEALSQVAEKRRLNIDDNI